MTSKSVGTPLSSIIQQWTLQQLQLQRQQQERQQPEQQEQQQQAPEEGRDVTTTTSSSSSSSSSFVYNHEPNHYTILYEKPSFSLCGRIQCAEPTINEHIYRHANVPTPKDIAIRESLGSMAWLLRIVEIAVTTTRKKSSSSSSSSRDNENSTKNDDTTNNATNNNSNPIEVIWIQTQTVNVTPLDCLPHNVRRNIRIIDLTTNNVNPYGWDDDENDGNINNNDDNDNNDNDATNNDSSKPSHNNDNDDYTMTNLSQLFHQLRTELSSIHKPVIVIWQSILPLILLHGFHSTYTFLSRLTLEKQRSGSTSKKKLPSRPRPKIPSCLQVWSIDTSHPSDILPSDQYAQLESLADAIMFWNHYSGTIEMMRRGVRERDNLLRSVMEFDLYSETIPAAMVGGNGDGGTKMTTTTTTFYRVHEYTTTPDAAGGNSEDRTKAPPKKTIHSSGTTDMESITVPDRRQPPSSSESDTNESNKRDAKKKSGRSFSRTSVQLTLEDDDDDGGRRQNKPSARQQQQQQPQSASTNSSISRPRIYIEDDDPEFADLDEDDPDDDLDF